MTVTVRTPLKALFGRFCLMRLGLLLLGGKEHINKGRKGNKHINNRRKEPFEFEIEKSPSKQELCHFVAAPWRQSQPPRKVEGGWTEHTRAGKQKI